MQQHSRILFAIDRNACECHIVRPRCLGDRFGTKYGHPTIRTGEAMRFAAVALATLGFNGTRVRLSHEFPKQTPGVVGRRSAASDGGRNIANVPRTARFRIVHCAPCAAPYYVCLGGRHVHARRFAALAATSRPSCPSTQQPRRHRAPRSAPAHAMPSGRHGASISSHGHRQPSPCCPSRGPAAPQLHLSPGQHHWPRWRAPNATNGGSVCRSDSGPGDRISRRPRA